jgi:hypothetical protein
MAHYMRETVLIKFLNCVGNVIFSGNMKVCIKNTVTKQVQEFIWYTRQKKIKTKIYVRSISISNEFFVLKVMVFNQHILPS